MEELQQLEARVAKDGEVVRELKAVGHLLPQMLVPHQIEHDVQQLSAQPCWVSGFSSNSA